MAPCIAGQCAMLGSNTPESYKFSAKLRTRADCTKTSDLNRKIPKTNEVKLKCVKNLIEAPHLSIIMS